MFVEKDMCMAICEWNEGKTVMVMDTISKKIYPISDFIGNHGFLHFLVDEPDELPDPEEQHTDEEFEALFEEVPEAALEEAKEHLSSITKEKRTRAEKRHMIETLAAEGSMVVSEIAERVGVSAATVRRYIK